MLSAAERRERARVGGLARAAKYAGYDVTRAAREARMRRYLHEVDPDGVLSQGERERRAIAARKRDMAKLTLASLRARRIRLGLAVGDNGERVFNPDDTVPM